MLKSTSTLLLIVCYVLQIKANMLGPGTWSLISIDKCSIELEEEIVTIDAYKHKLNRTHDGISADGEFLDDVGDNYGALIEICRYVDGGCKPSQVLSDNSVVNLLKQYGSEENVIHALALAGIDPPDFPIPKGKYHVDDYMIDYCKLPRDSLYGKFEGVGYVMRGPDKVACLKVVLEFNKFDEEDLCGDS